MELRNRTVSLLVIDGQRSESDRLERELRNVGFPFSMTVSDPSVEVLRDLSKKGFRPDAVLCPFSLPGTNMLKVLQSARSVGFDTPFILLAYDLSEDIAIELLAVGVEDYITRSTLKRLPVAIRKAIQRHETLNELRRGHARLEASEQSIRNMVRNMPMEVAMFDRDMRYLVVSDEWTESMGMAHGDIIGRHMYDLSPHLPERWKQAHQRGLAGETMSHEGESYDYRGETRWLRWKMNPWYGSEGTIGGIVLFVENITDAMISEMERKELNERLNMAIESANLGLWSWKFGSDRIVFNDHGAQIYGFSEPSVPVQEVGKGVHPDDRERIASALHDTFYNKALYDEEYRFIRADGNEISVHSMGRASHDHNGFPAHMYGILLDRTERAGLEREIREREQLFRDMAENITEVFWLTDYQANRILYMSPQYEKLFGKTVQSIYDEPASWADNIHPDDRPGIVDAFRMNAPLGKFDVEYRIVHPDGNTYWVRDRAFPIRDEQGNVLRIAGISQDITREKQLQG